MFEFSRLEDRQLPRHFAISVSQLALWGCAYLSCLFDLWSLASVKTLPVDRFARQSQAIALVGLPVLWLIMSLLHFHSLEDLFILRLRYSPHPAADTVNRLIVAHNRWPMIHDPHWIGYLSLPLLVLGAFGLYALGRRVRPAIAALGVSLTVTGCLYIGGVFGLFTSLMRGLGDVDPRFTDGAIATYAAATADHGAYGLTRTLAELALLGLAVQAIALWRAPHIPCWATATIVLGCTLFLLFWDIDNLMIVGEICLIAGLLPISRELWRDYRAT